MAGEEKLTKEETSAPEKKLSKKTTIAGIVTGFLVLELAIFFVGFKIFSKGPAEALGLERYDNVSKIQTENPEHDTQEVLIANLECPHTNTGRLYVIRMTIYASVPKELMKKTKEEGGHGGGYGSKSSALESTGVQSEIEKRIATIKDRMRTVIASSDAGTLCLGRSEKSDYGLSTLRRQFKTILDEVIGKGKVKDVLISDYMQTPID